MLLLAKAGKGSIKPFPSHKRLDRQLQAIGFTRLDKSDFRYEVENIKAIRPAPAWVNQLLRKLAGKSIV
jgi:hypothetical protein